MSGRKSGGREYPAGRGRAPAVFTALAAVCVLATSAAAQESSLNDAQIAHIAVTANAIDVEIAELVASRTSTESVRQFASTMIQDHTGVNERAAALAARLGVTPQENAVSQQLRAEADSVAAALRPLRGEAFDRAYVAREVAYHAAVLSALDGALIPNTSNAELRQLLVAVRPAIVAHLEHARELQSSLSAAE
ncbi:MAG TPA: DUF4142 domain-containing protein [Longimicrobiales bacterium]|nr:DUF4142 domain-containing protein [Longimicrobiales bacterium]